MIRIPYEPFWNTGELSRRAERITAMDLSSDFVLGFCLVFGCELAWMLAEVASVFFGE